MKIKVERKAKKKSLNLGSGVPRGLHIAQNPTVMLSWVVTLNGVLPVYYMPSLSPWSSGLTYFILFVKLLKIGLKKTAKGLFVQELLIVYANMPKV